MIRIDPIHHSDYSGGHLEAAKVEALIVEALLKDICQNVGGEWLLLGGSLVQLEYDGDRATADIDLLSLSHPDLSETRTQDELFKAAIRLGLDAESVNSAARFFLTETPGWESELIEWKKGAKGRVYRPSLTLFVALKLKRGTEVDIRDIEFAVKKEGASAFMEERFTALADAKTQALFVKLRSRFGI